MLTETRIPDLPSAVYMVVLENNKQRLNKNYVRLYIKPQFVKQFINLRPAQKHLIHVYVRDADMGDIDWREITPEFVK